jgi:beta-glucosidase
MTLADELDLVDLHGVKGYENATRAIPALCIPRLTLEDGPDGLTNADTGVTQLPSSLAVAATFDTADAYADGAVEGAEAHAQGVDVVQAPMLNIDRVPEDGRAFETYGEDPTVVSDMGVADIDGIQSHGVMSDAKHFTGYTQEGDRHALNQIISQRQLEEIYLAPFAAAVKQADVASIMCAYGVIDGHLTCADPALYRVLASWGFHGFVRSDMSAVRQPAAAFEAGMDAIKPAMPRRLAADVADGKLRRGRLAAAAQSILAEMFRFDLVARPLTGRTDTPVDTPARAAVDLDIAEASTVLLKDGLVKSAPVQSGRVGESPPRQGPPRSGSPKIRPPKSGSPKSWVPALPVDFSKLSSLAVIGTDAAGQAMSAGWGGARVVAPFLVEPLTALGALLRHGTLRYATGGSGGYTKTGTSGTAPIPRRDELLDARAKGAPGIPTSLIPEADRPNIWRSTVTVVPPASGLYDLSLKDDSASWLLVNGQVLFDDPERHELSTWSASTFLHAGRPCHIEVLWRQVPRGPRPTLGWKDVSPLIAAAAKVAGESQVAVVFASDFSSEGVDRPDLDLPGDQNELISAVAAANPDTIVVLNTAGAVLMPWLSKVAAVVEAWYPGEEDGNAIAAVLSGRFDPSGRLPVTFPASEDAVPAHTLASFPGIDGIVEFSEGLDVGYRWYQAHHVQPLFPFGFGLSYTSFRLSGLRLTRDGDGATLRLRVADTGRLAGAEVVQAYVGFPRAAREPPWELEAFTRVQLSAGESRLVTLQLPASAFRCFIGQWQTVPGRYLIRVATSSANLNQALRASLVLATTQHVRRSRAARR